MNMKPDFGAPKLTVAATVLVLLLSGCETLDPYTGESKTSNATKGAIIGALALSLALSLASSRATIQSSAVSAH